MSGRPMNKPENNRPLVRQMQRWYWEATGEHWYPEKRAIQYVLCKLRQEYDLSKKDEAEDDER
jgi:hypothetical protein